MSKQLTSEDGKRSLTAHAAEKGAEIQTKYGPRIGWNQLMQILEDRTVVRYPCEVRFDASVLHAGEFAHPVPKGEHPRVGFVIHVHPVFLTQIENVPHLVLYQIVLVNYGEFATAAEAEAFGAAAMGMSPDDFYALICRLADENAAVHSVADGAS